MNGPNEPKEPDNQNADAITGRQAYNVVSDTVIDDGTLSLSSALMPVSVLSCGKIDCR